MNGIIPGKPQSFLEASICLRKLGVTRFGELPVVDFKGCWVLYHTIDRVKTCSLPVVYYTVLYEYLCSPV